MDAISCPVYSQKVNGYYCYLSPITSQYPSILKKPILKYKFTFKKKKMEQKLLPQIEDGK